MIIEMEIDNGGEDTGSIQTEKDVEKQGMSEQTNGDGGKSSKTAEKKSQMKEGMGDRTGQEKGDKRKRSNAAERGQKGEKGQGKDSGNIPSHNREDPEDGQGSVQKRSKGTEEHRSAPEKKDKTKVAFADLILSVNYCLKPLFCSDSGQS